MLPSSTLSHLWITCVVVLSTLILSLLGMALMPAGLNAVSPLLLLPMAYGWRLLLPEALPVIAIFLIGLTNDVLMGLPLGTLPLTALFLTLLARRDKKQNRRNALTVLLYFLVHLAMATLLLAAILSVYQGSVVSLPPLGMQYVLTASTFPLLYWLSRRLTQELTGEECD